METTTFATALTVREAESGSDIAATVEGLAVPYGVEVSIGAVRESFAPDAIDPASVIGAPLCWRHGEPIGVVREAHNTAEGLAFTAEIAATTQGRDAATLTRLGGMGVSIGFTPEVSSWNGARDKVTHTRASVGEISLTHLPAYPVGVGSIREENTVDDTTTPTVAEATAPQESREFATRDEVQALRDRIASVGVTVTERPADPDEFLREYGTRLLKRAWTDIKVDGTASDIRPVPAGVSAVVEYGRPTVTAIGVSALAAEGMDAAWMLDNVLPTLGKQAGEKTDTPSGPASGQVVTAPVETFAGGNDISIQFMQRASVWDYPHLMRLFAEQYARQTNLAVSASVIAAAANTIILPDSGLTDAVLGEKLGWAAGKIAEGTGRAPSTLILSPGKFFQVGVITGNGYPLAGGNVGNADLASLSYSAFGLRVVCDPTLAGSGSDGYLIDPASIGVKENPGAPLSMTANVPARLGVDVAVYGFMAHKVLNAEGIVSVIPTAAAASAKA